ncbi:hypothetical protein D7X55_21440 [Corallococcus sp. AB049A]|nr:hypothetical protein D7X55_21440 [Corallococcus sp. AB049A]
MWASWSDEAIFIQRSSPDGLLAPQRIARRMLAGHRYFLRLFRLSDGTLWLRGGAGEGTAIDAADAAGVFHPLEGWPEELATLPPYCVVPMADGTVAGLPSGESRLLLWRPGVARPVLREFPEGFLARDVARDPRGRLWVAGSTRGAERSSLERRAALATSQDNGLSWQTDEVARGTLRATWHRFITGADVEYRTVDALGKYLVVTSELGDINAPSTHVFVRDGEGKWGRDILRHDVFRAAMTFDDGHLEILSHHGRSIPIVGGHRWRSSTLIPRIRNALRDVNPFLDADARFEVLSADASPEGKALLVVSVRSLRERLARVGEALVVLGPDRDEAFFFQSEPGPEVVTARFASG